MTNSRPERIELRVTLAEKLEMIRRARTTGLSLSDYLRKKGLDGPDSKPKHFF